MNGFVATSRPAGALLDAQGMVRTPNENLTAADLLEVAFQAEIRIAHREHLGVHRAMGRVTNRASFT